MDTDEIIRHAHSLIEDSKSIGRDDGAKFKGLKARTCEFLINISGSKNTFLAQIEKLSGSPGYGASVVSEVLKAFITHLEAGLMQGMSPKRQAELDVVSDLLEQANVLLENNKVHPAAPAVLIGATLEEFLRTWLEDKDISIGNKKPGLDSYSKTLRENELISKQDIKDITAWAGIRNHAAHGEWDKIGDKARIRLMLDGINLFMRKYTT